MYYGTVAFVPRNNLRYWRLQRKLSIADMAFTSDVSPRLITKIEAAPDDYILKSDTMEKIAAGLGVPAFLIFFPDDVALLNKMMHDMLLRQARVFTAESMVNMFQQHPTSDDASAPRPQTHSAGRRSY